MTNVDAECQALPATARLFLRSAGRPGGPQPAGIDPTTRNLLTRLARSEEMADRLSRYVPGAIEGRIRCGLDVTCGRQEVTVLFVDLHGFTGFAESLSPEAVFETLSRYTCCVSHVLREHGGTVVEFNGDGMMAVFGAPDSLADKERAAVCAARVLARALAQPGLLPAPAPPVGIGIASGEGYVGSIQSADRLIWSAVGNPTNLASRLQRLAHAMQTPIVLDAATWWRAGSVARDFRRRPGTRIRGKSHPLDIFTLPEQVSP